MVLRTISPFYDTRDMIQTHTYASDQVILLLIIHIYRDEVILSGVHELIAFHIGVFIFLKVIIITQVGCSISLDVFTFSFQVLQLGLLCLDSFLQSCYLRAEASNGVVLLGTLIAK